MNKKILSAAVLAVLLTGCATESAQVTQQPETNIPSENSSQAMPAWVFNPSSANGFAASNCVTASGNFSVDRNHVVSLTRNTLAQNMDLKANVLEKTYQKMDSAAGVSTTGTSFEQIAKQITSVSLQKSQVEQIAVVQISGIDQVCALVTMPKMESEKLFNNMVETNTVIDPTDKAALYKEFMSQKTTKELENQVNTLSEVTDATAPVAKES
ncbi:hypothetical protein C9J48_00540 [Photobacterium profundum]|uniref:Putative orphan protein n=1 Tax=Photobacterium profundum 3TCK TaxID=314280 RepID=Q1YY18_9GAMM|nr:hypothetical protein [Photobacterium profundum]EAS41187.1 putative orphan protein [Photobacterium profundum 3TCK]PSV63991.1 hypothetical protein C9J48_00540 [Photobacterium profundum]